MGFNIIGVAVDKKFADKGKLCQDLKIGQVQLVETDEVFENAISSYEMEDDSVFITETEQGTLLTFGTGIDIAAIRIDHISEGGNALLFIIGDTVGMYLLFFASNGKVIRYLEYNDGERRKDQGKPLPAEIDSQETDGAIFDLIGQLLGVSFWSLEPDITSSLYKKLQK